MKIKQRKKQQQQKDKQTKAKHNRTIIKKALHLERAQA